MQGMLRPAKQVAGIQPMLHSFPRNHHYRKWLLDHPGQRISAGSQDIIKAFNLTRLSGEDQVSASL
jgi:hypothetical protein